MDAPALNVVTGAFGYTGKYITRRLLVMGERVRTITGHPDRPNPFGKQVSAFPFNFDRPDELTKSLQGATTLYNTYWVRFSHGQATFDNAVKNTLTLLKSAGNAGVRRIVHVSITNASAESSLPYFKGKGLLEEAIIDSGLSYAIIRPTVIFGIEDILINNITWILKNYPLFAVFGAGNYQIQPVYVEDMAGIAVSAAHKHENMIIDAVGPEIYTYNELVRLIARKVRSRARIVHLKPGLAYLMGKILGLLVKDVTVTRDEIEGLMSGLLVSKGEPTGQTRLSEWLDQNAGAIGTGYASELARHYRRS
jgi:NADH dehydrogenase